MRSIDEFIETAAAASKPPESELAYAAQRATKQFDVEQSKLIRQIRVRDGQVVFANGAKDVQDSVIAAEAKMEAVRSDILVYLNALQEAGSLQQLVEQLARHRRTIANVQRDYDNLLKQLINKGKERPQDEPEAQAAADKRDRVVQELTPVVEGIQKRVEAAKSVLQRYLTWMRKKRLPYALRPKLSQLTPLMKRTTMAELRSSNGNEITKTTVRYTSGAVIDG